MNDTTRRSAAIGRLRSWLRSIGWPPSAEPHDRFGLLLALLVTSYLVSSLNGQYSHTLAVVLNILTVLVAFRATGMRSWHRLWLVAIAGLAGTAIASTLSNDGATVVVVAWCQAAVLAAILLAVVGRILQHDAVHAQTLLGAFSAYFLIGLTYSWLYIGLNQISSPPFFGYPAPNSDFAYFSFVTLTTLGFGDLTPAGGFNRRLVTIEALTGQIFLASLVSRLVSLYGGRRGQLPSRPAAGGRTARRGGERRR